MRFLRLFLQLLAILSPTLYPCAFGAPDWEGAYFKEAKDVYSCVSFGPSVSASRKLFSLAVVRTNGRSVEQSGTINTTKEKYAVASTLIPGCKFEILKSPGKLVVRADRPAQLFCGALANELGGTYFLSDKLGAICPKMHCKSTVCRTLGPGEVDESAIQPVPILKKLIAANMNQIRHCYEQLLQRTPKAAGKLTAAFTIDLNGQVSDLSLTSDGLNDKAMNDCVEGKIRGWQLPDPNRKAPEKVTYPFVFNPL